MKILLVGDDMESAGCVIKLRMTHAIQGIYLQCGESEINWGLSNDERCSYISSQSWNWQTRMLVLQMIERQVCQTLWKAGK